MDGELWFAETDGNQIGMINPADAPPPSGTGVITQYTIPTPNSEPEGITSLDGNLWFTESLADRVAEYNPATGTYLTFYMPLINGSPDSNYPTSITAGPDGNIWFTESMGNTIGMVNTTSGAIAQYPIPTANSQPYGITAGPDGNIWFAETKGDNIGMFSLSTHQFAEYPLAPNSEPTAITAGPDGNIWFSDSQGIGIVNLKNPPPPTGSGTITFYSAPTANNLPFGGITAGPDGNIWFTEPSGDNIGTFNLTTKTFTMEYSVPTAGSTPLGITAGPDGNIWFTEYSGNNVGVLELPKTVVVNVSGSQNFGSSSPAFTYTTASALPSGVTMSGSLTCLTVNDGDPISPTLAAGGQYTLDGASCSGLSISDPTDYSLFFVGAPSGFVVNSQVPPVPVYIANTGDSNVVEVSPGGAQQIVVNSAASGEGPLQGPVAVAVDAEGDLYVVDETADKVTEVPADGGPQVTIASGLFEPTGVAVDAAGDVFIVGGDVTEVPPGGKPIVLDQALFAPQAIAVDNAGDVFIADSGDGRIVEVPVGESPTPLTIFGLGVPLAVAVDSKGDLFIVEMVTANTPAQPTEKLIEVTPNGEQFTLLTSLSTPDPLDVASGTTGVAVDAAGDVYVANSGANDILELPAAGGPPTVIGSGLKAPYGVAVPPLAASASVPGSSGGSVGLTAGGGGTFSDVTDVAADTYPAPPSGVTLPDGVIGFTLSGLAPNQIVEVVLSLPVAANSYYKYVNNAWVDFTNAQFANGGKQVTLTLTADATGTIVDPGAPAVVAPLTITASTGTMSYGGAVPAISAIYSGFVNGDTASSLSTAPTCSTTATSFSPVGTYPTSCSGAADPNYSISYVGGSVSVDPGNLVVTASSASITYGSTVPAFAPNYSGFVNTDSASSLTSPATCTASVPSNTPPAGIYPVICSGAADPNYAISYVAGTLKVGPASLVVTAPGPTGLVGSAAPSLMPSYSGFVNDDTVSSLSSPATCTTTATSASPPGAYPVTCSGAADSDYAISYVAGTLTVVPSASLTFTGSITYSNTGPITSGSVKVGTTNGVAGTIGIPGVKGGTATVSVALVRVLGIYIGVVTASDPSVHLNAATIVVSPLLELTSAGQVTGTATGLYKLRPYTLAFSVSVS